MHGLNYGADTTKFHYLGGYRSPECSRINDTFGSLVYAILPKSHPAKLSISPFKFSMSMPVIMAPKSCLDSSSEIGLTVAIIAEMLS